MCRLLGGDDAQKSTADDEAADVDVCGLSEDEPDTVEPILDEMLNEMQTHLDNAEQNISATTKTATDGETAAAVCSTLMDSDVGPALDAALQAFDIFLNLVSKHRLTQSRTRS